MQCAIDLSCGLCYIFSSSNSLDGNVDICENTYVSAIMTEALAFETLGSVKSCHEKIIFTLCKCERSIHIVSSTTSMLTQAHLKSEEHMGSPLASGCTGSAL